MSGALSKHSHLPMLPHWFAMAMCFCRFCYHCWWQSKSLDLLNPLVTSALVLPLFLELWFVICVAVVVLVIAQLIVFEVDHVDHVADCFEAVAKEFISISTQLFADCHWNPHWLFYSLLRKSIKERKEHPFWMLIDHLTKIRGFLKAVTSTVICFLFASKEKHQSNFSHTF